MLGRNLQGGVHVDKNNAQGFPNCVLKLSSFEGGIWIHNELGDVPCPDPNVPDLMGCELKFESNRILFNPHHKHCAMPRHGATRDILVAYTTNHTDRLTADQTAELQCVGFALPEQPGHQASSPAGPEEGSPPLGRVPDRFRTWVGVPWTCDEFIEQALEAKHPRLMSSGVPPELQQTIDFLASEGMHTGGASRTEALRQWLGRAAELDEQERVYKETLPKHCAKTLSKKRLLLFGEMIEAAGHNDPSLVADMSKGFALGGPIPYCPEFRAKRTAATMAAMTCEGQHNECGRAS